MKLAPWNPVPEEISEEVIEEAIEVVAEEIMAQGVEGILGN